MLTRSPAAVGLLLRIGILGISILGIAACSPAPTPASTAASPPSQGVPAIASPAPVTDGTASPEVSPTPGIGFAFTAEAVLGFYEGDGFTCGEPQPSASADGWTVQQCERTDDAGQRLGIGVVTDPEGALGDGYASVTAADGEELVTPEDALDHLSGFLGAMLGDARASAVLPWLAGSMGNEYEEVGDGDLRVATFLQPRDDPRTIWLEVAGPDYLATPAP